MTIDEKKLYTVSGFRVEARNYRPESKIVLIDMILHEYTQSGPREASSILKLIFLDDEVLSNLDDLVSEVKKQLGR